MADAFFTSSPILIYLTALRAFLPPLSAEEQAPSTKHYCCELNRFGLISVIDASGGDHHFPKDYAGSKALALEGELPERITNFLSPRKKGAELKDFQT